MREMNMALRKYSTEERKRVKATLAHLDAAVARLQQEMMRHPSCSVRKEELKVKESQLAAYLASEQERVSLMAGVKELREGELPGKLMSAKVKTRKERTMITSLQWKGTVRKDSRGILEAASQFYTELFSEPTSTTDSTFWTVAPDRKLGDEQSQLLVEDWSEAEVKEALDEMLLFNRCLLLNGKSPAGRQKAAKPLKRSVMGDFIKIAVDGSRALKSPQELERAFGGSDGAKLAMRIFDAAPNEWKQMLMAPVTARTVLTVSKFVLRAGASYGVWRIECVEGETLVCRAIRCFRGVLEEAEERTHIFLPHEVVPAVVREGRLLGPAGGPRARLLCSPIWEGDRPAQLKQLKEGFRRFGGKPKQQSTWEESLGRPIDWGRVIGIVENTIGDSK
ncbi:unnamed protein product [Closterium sp. NIES-64]|nr:unnamed protein product [Closterium sp. NIES-64]